MQAIDPAIGVANRLLEREDWARTRLSSHAGSTFRIVCGPLASTLSIAAGGMLVSAQGTADLAPSLTLSVSPLRLPTLLAQPERWTELVAAEGDAALASTIEDLAQTLPWLVEQSFASVFGPLIGTRVADAGRALLTLPEHAARSFGSSLGSYSRDEGGLGMDRGAFVDFSAEVAAVAARVDALAARFDEGAGTHHAKVAPGKKLAQ